MTNGRAPNRDHKIQASPTMANPSFPYILLFCGFFRPKIRKNTPRTADMIKKLIPVFSPYIRETRAGIKSRVPSTPSIFPSMYMIIFLFIIFPPHLH